MPPSQPPVTTLQLTDLPMLAFLAWILALRYSGMSEESGYPSYPGLPLAASARQACGTHAL